MFLVVNPDFSQYTSRIILELLIPVALDTRVLRCILVGWTGIRTWHQVWHTPRQHWCQHRLRRSLRQEGLLQMSWRANKPKVQLITSPTYSPCGHRSSDSQHSVLSWLFRYNCISQHHSLGHIQHHGHCRWLQTIDQCVYEFRNYYARADTSWVVMGESADVLRTGLYFLRE